MLAICEQLIEYERAAAIERRVLGALGRRWVGWDGGHSTLADMPVAERLAGTAPALLESFDLAGCRAITLVKAAREVARGRIDLHDERHERGWRRLRAIPGIGPWTVEMTGAARAGPPRPAPGGRPRAAAVRRAACSPAATREAFAEEPQVRELFAPYGEWAGLAAAHAIGL